MVGQEGQGGQWGIPVLVVGQDEWAQRGYRDLGDGTRQWGIGVMVVGQERGEHSGYSGLGGGSGGRSGGRGGTVGI